MQRLHLRAGRGGRGELGRGQHRADLQLGVQPLLVELAAQRRGLLLQGGQLRRVDVARGQHQVADLALDGVQLLHHRLHLGMRGLVDLGDLGLLIGGQRNAGEQRAIAAAMPAEMRREPVRRIALCQGGERQQGGADRADRPGLAVHGLVSFVWVWSGGYEVRWLGGI